MSDMSELRWEKSPNNDGASLLVVSGLEKQAPHFAGYSLVI